MHPAPEILGGGNFIYWSSVSWIGETFEFTFDLLKEYCAHQQRALQCAWKWVLNSSVFGTRNIKLLLVELSENTGVGTWLLAHAPGNAGIYLKKHNKSSKILTVKFYSVKTLPEGIQQSDNTNRSLKKKCKKVERKNLSRTFQNRDFQPSTESPFQKQTDSQCSNVIGIVTVWHFSECDCVPLIVCTRTRALPQFFTLRILSYCNSSMECIETLLRSCKASCFICLCSVDLVRIWWRSNTRTNLFTKNG